MKLPSGAEDIQCQAGKELPEEEEDTEERAEDEESEDDDVDTSGFDGSLAFGLGVDAVAAAAIGGAWGVPGAVGWLNPLSMACPPPTSPCWDARDEAEDNLLVVQGYRVAPCEQMVAGVCQRKASPEEPRCFGYHGESQARRPPFDITSGQLQYWAVPCASFDGTEGSCSAGLYCMFAHGKAEEKYHPASYRTELCTKGEDCKEECCDKAHSEEELRTWAPERYSPPMVAAMLPRAGFDAGLFGAKGFGNGVVDPAGNGAGNGAGGPVGKKNRFCVSYQDGSVCRRGALCGFAHTRDEIETPLLCEAEERQDPEAMTEEFFTQRFKCYWCPLGGQHDWHSCVYAHTYQDARRLPTIGYGPQPCPFWSKKETRAAYSQRCPLGIRCAYSHGAKEQLYHPKYFRTVICRDLQAKGCPRRKLCAFFHHRKEKRAVSPDRVDYERPLAKSQLPEDWQVLFMAPPFFQESGEDEEGERAGKGSGRREKGGNPFDRGAGRRKGKGGGNSFAGPWAGAGAEMAPFGMGAWGAGCSGYPMDFTGMDVGFGCGDAMAMNPWWGAAATGLASPSTEDE
eukprot:TRINITY_DN15405_c0_g1_i2.p1 TRINITY_DN15405_c0_g1~~TRINITY_DN15405_c0_g1_i2.p1  ORF type:complete len:568 (+),score=112.37 TRINITY_DN15405_c0_g1_i2:281-1984(+)